MARRTWWKVGALLAAMAVFLTMLPATALAAVPEGQIIYVGNESVTNGGYWTTDSNGNVTAHTGGDTPTDNYIHYDAANNTLTLHNATIKESVSTDTSTFIPGTAIGVLNESGAAKLTITLVGTNTIEDVSTGIFVLAHSSSTGDATLTITGSGSLDASGSVNGIMVQSNSGDATLTIQSADVTLTSNSGNGVTVQAGSTDSSGEHTITLSVEGGSLTASGSTGISFDSASPKTVSATNLTVSNNAIVRANDVGSNISNVDLQIGKGNNSSGGIVFDGNQGTVYGSVELQENLTIGEGESLTIPDGASLDTNGKLTVDGGTLTQNGAVTGDIIYKVTGVSLSTDSLTLEEGGTANLTATITPANATNQNVTWSSNAPSVATVNSSGNVTAMAPGTATITVTTEDGNKTATCAVTVAAATVPVTGVTLSQSQARLYYNGTPNTLALTATVAPDNATNKVVAWTSSNSAVATVDGSGNVTAVAPGTANITVTTADGSKTAACLVTVTGVYIPPRPSGPDWGDVADNIADAEPGSTVKVDMDGKTVLPGEVLDELAGLDVTLALDMGDGLIWEIYGGDVPADAEYDDVDLGVALGGDDIPADVANLVTGESGSVQVSLEHDGPFGFELTLVAPLGEDAAGLVANLYCYDDEAGSLGYEATAQVDSEGVARLPFDHASSWLVALDSRSHALPFPDALEGEWYSEAVRWAWLDGIMRGNGDGTLRPADALTRSQMACLLHNAAGSPASPSAGLPGDCEAGSWYAGAVSWALGAGVMNGHGDGSFAPGGALTREEAACVLMNAAGLAGMDVSARADLSGFADAGDVSGWAREALSWAVAEGVMNGVGAGDGSLELQPARPCTRAEAAALLMNLARSAG